MKQRDKNRISGIVGTILFHLLILAAFIFFGLTTPLPLPGEEGVEVNLGNFSEGMGEVQRPVISESATPPPPQPQKPPEEVVEEENITQDIEEAPMLEPEVTEKKEEKDEVPEEPIEEEIEEEVVEEPKKEPEKPKVDPRALYTGKKEQGTETSNEGITGKPGDQGMPTGTPEPKTYTGPGGEGEGVSYSLGGRGALRLPKPEYKSKEQGKVVVDIWVDKTGRVVRAEAGAKGTNISDLELREQARQAALQSTFSPDPNAPDLQRGTITYNFIRLN